MALFNECMQSFGQIVLDTTNIIRDDGLSTIETNAVSEVLPIPRLLLMPLDCVQK